MLPECLFSNANDSISTSDHMFGRAIWDKSPACIFENFEPTCGYWLITPNQR